MQNSISLNRIMKGVLFGLIIGIIMATSACTDASAQQEQMPLPCHLTVRVQRQADSSTRHNVKLWVKVMAKDSTVQQITYNQERMRTSMARHDSVWSAKVRTAIMVDSLNGCMGR